MRKLLTPMTKKKNPFNSRRRRQKSLMLESLSAAQYALTLRHLRRFCRDDFICILQTALLHWESTLWRWRLCFSVLFLFFLLERHARNNHGKFQKSGTNSAEQNWCVALLIDFNLAWSSGGEHSWRLAETSRAVKSAVVTLLQKGSTKPGTQLGKWWNWTQHE